MSVGFFVPDGGEVGVFWRVGFGFGVGGFLVVGAVGVLGGILGKKMSEKNLETRKNDKWFNRNLRSKNVYIPLTFNGENTPVYALICAKKFILKLLK